MLNKLPKSLNTVTTFSKLLAIFLLFVLPITGFYLGMKYQSNLLNNSHNEVFSSNADKMPSKQISASKKMSPEEIIIQLPQLIPEVTWEEEDGSLAVISTDKVMNKPMGVKGRNGKGSSKTPVYGNYQAVVEILENSGWTNYTIADAPGQTYLTYTKNVGNRQQVFEISTRLTNIPSDDPQAPPVTCPCEYSISAYYSDPF